MTASFAASSATSFVAVPSSFFPKETQILRESFREKIAELQRLRDTELHHSQKRPYVVILGAGPAGLIRAIVAIVNGNRVTVVEKRSQDQEGRLNAILLTHRTIDILKDYGVYHYLAERNLFGSSSNEERFSCSVTICDLEAAMKAVIEALQKDEKIIHFRSQVDHVVNEPGRAIDLVLRIDERARSTLRSVDVLIVAEGVKSTTLEKVLNGRRVEVLPPVAIIGGIFKTAGHVGQSFFSNVRGVMGAIVLYAPGLCSIGYMSFSKKAKALSQLLVKPKSKETDVAKNTFLKGAVEEIFSQKECGQQKAPSFEDNPLVTVSTISSDFALPFCGRVGERTLFFLAGDSLSQVDATSGYGANNAIGSFEDILPALCGAEESARILNGYKKRTVEKIEKSMEKLHCARLWVWPKEIYPPDEKAYSFARWQLTNHEAVVRIQNIVGARFLKMCLKFEWGKKLFRYAVQRVRK